MKLDSPFFNRIRVKPQEDARPRPQAAVCQWPGCASEGTHRAPKGRSRENEYWRFCLAHVREYNQSYNYFAGMSDDAVLAYQKDAVTGHRPTWKMGMNGGRPTKRSHSARFEPGVGDADDPLGLFRHFGARAGDEHLRRRETRVIRNAERKALDALGLEPDATTAEVKIRFKSLVKRHHPDANNGDRSTEDKLREIIQAYNYLKTAGYR
jgi:hypothetical protein